MNEQNTPSEWPKIFVLITIFSLFLAVIDFIFQLVGGIPAVLFFDSVPLTILTRFLITFVTILIVIKLIEMKGFMQ